MDALDATDSRSAFGRITVAMTAPTNRWTVFGLLALLCGLIYLPGLGDRELKGEEERRILPALDMIRSGNWTQPVLGGEPYHTKPPMINWIVAGSFLLTGVVHEWTARIPSVLGMLAFLAVLALRPCAAVSPRARLFAGIVFLTNIGMWEKGRLIEMEALLVAITGSACLWWVFARLDGASALSQWGVPCLLLGVGLLLKGPPIIVFFYGFVGCVVLAERRLRDLFHPAHLAGAALACGSFVLWYALSAREASHASVSHGLAHEAFARFLSMGSGVGEWLRIGAMACVNFLPWIVCVPLLWHRELTAGLDERTRRIVLGSRWGVVLPFVALAWAPGTSARYTLPVFPMAALLLGFAFDRLESSAAERRVAKPAILLGLAAAVAALFAGWALVTMSFAATILALVAGGVTVMAYLHSDWFDARIGRAWGTAALAVFAGLGYAVHVTPLLAERDRFRPAAETIAELVPASETVHVFRPGPQEFLFYIDQPFDYVLTGDEVTPDVEFLVIREADLAKLVAERRVDTAAIRELGALPERIDGAFRVVQLGGEPAIAAGSKNGERL